MGPTTLDEEPPCSPVHEVAAARTALEQSEGLHGPARTARAAIWHWDLTSDRVEWDERLKALFGYAEMVTDAAWRENASTRKTATGSRPPCSEQPS